MLHEHAFSRTEMKTYKYVVEQSANQVRVQLACIELMPIRPNQDEKNRKDVTSLIYSCMMHAAGFQTNDSCLMRRHWILQHPRFDTKVKQRTSSRVDARK